MSTGPWEISMKKLGGQGSGCTNRKLMPTVGVWDNSQLAVKVVLSDTDIQLDIYIIVFSDNRQCDSMTKEL